ncbi:MAG: hypothetical protein IPO36_21585 [Anaerolineales bacterium]|nr:hypothetical protein [Anaerolineales bacterium]
MTFTALWGGAPAAGTVQVVPADQLLDAAWNQMPAWAIIPFEQIEPKWKVLTIDGQSPIQKSFDSIIYPLTVTYRLTCSEPCQVPDELDFSYQNRDPDKLATVILTPSPRWCGPRQRRWTQKASPIRVRRSAT